MKIPILFFSLLLSCAASADIISNLEAYYTFNNSLSVGTDSSGNSRDGIVAGTAAGAVDAERGAVLALTGGASGHIEVAIPMLPGSGFTLSTWVKSDSFASNRGLFQVQNGGGTLSTMSKPIGGWVGSTGIPWGRVIESSNTAQNLPQAGPALSSGVGATWHHLAYRGNGSTYEVFIDGSNAGTSSIAYDGTILTHSHLFIGRQANEAWNGVMDDFRVYSRALSDSDIQQLASGIPEPTSGTLVLFGMAVLVTLRRRPR